MLRRRDAYLLRCSNCLTNRKILIVIKCAKRHKLNRKIDSGLSAGVKTSGPAARVGQGKLKADKVVAWAGDVRVPGERTRASAGLQLECTRARGADVLGSAGG